MQEEEDSHLGGRVGVEERHAEDHQELLGVGKQVVVVGSEHL